MSVEPIHGEYIEARRQRRLDRLELLARIVEVARQAQVERDSATALALSKQLVELTRELRRRRRDG